MNCLACGWCPPKVRVRAGVTEPATDRWRWNRLFEHIFDAASAEHYAAYLRGVANDGPHKKILDGLEAQR